MLLSQRPLSSAEMDAQLAIQSRCALAERVGRNVQRQRNTLLLGPRGSGRTSMLSLVERELRDVSGVVVRRVDAEGCLSTSELVDSLRAALGDDPRQDEVQRIGPEHWRLTYGLEREVVVKREANETDAGRIAAAARHAVPEGEVFAVIVDNLNPDQAHDVFGRFRDSLWDAPVVWVGAGDADRDGYLNPPADVFWESVVWLDRLERDEVEELLRLRLEAADDGDPDVSTIRNHLQVLVETLADATPREVVRAAADVAEHGSLGPLKGSAERLARAHDAGGRRAAMVLSELERMGRPVHAGDEELLGRLGLTRPRLVQLLGTLEQAELVHRHREGRRILFEVAS